MGRLMRWRGAGGKSAIAAAALLALAGCGSGPAVPVAESGPDVRAQVKAMARGARHAVFIRAIRDAGQACQQVVDDRFLGDARDRSLWAVSCEDRGRWAVAVARGGDAQVTGCGAPGGQPCGPPPWGD